MSVDHVTQRSPDRDPLRQVADAVVGLILRLDATGHVTFASAGGRQLLGAAFATLVGRPLREAVHPEDQAALDAASRQGAAGATIVRMRGDGQLWIAVKMAFRDIPDTGDRVATLHEASEHERTHTKLRTSRDHYRALVDTLPQLVWMERDDTGETVYVNQAFEAYCGRIPTTRAARTACFHPDDAGQIEGAYAKALAQGGSCEVQGRVRDRTDRYRWHQFVFRPLHMGRELVGWLGSALDIDEIVSAREALEEKSELLRLAQEAAGAGLFDADLGTRDVVLSPASARQLGFQGDRPAVVGLPDLMRRVVPEDRRTALRSLREAASGRKTFDVAFRVPTRAEGPRWIQAIGRSNHDRTGTAVRLVGLTLDITARKDGEHALIEAKAAADTARTEAERANAAKTDFLSAMSHEIRTPLNAVIGFAGLLAGSGRLDGDLRRYAELAGAAGENLRTVVDDILDFSSVEAGAVSLHPEPFEVRPLVEGCIGIVGAPAAAKGLEVASLIDDGVPGALVGDAGRLRQILLNLLNNAVKFTPQGGVTVSLSHDGPTPRGERIRFSVTDTGIGIAADQQDRLFRRFSQADSSIRRDFGGTGLGLAISHRLVELMGGTIGLASEAGRGATFWFTLTLPQARTGWAPAPVAQALPERKGRILLVEDIEINRELACTVLEAAGHVVDVATDGIGAVRAVGAGDYDLVLMDVQMPRLDGMMATRLIRCLPGPGARVPVIAMTANVLPDQVRAFRDAGMDDHFGKPFRPQELCAAVARWLGAAVQAAETQDDVIAERTPTIDRARYEDNLALLAPETLTRLLENFHARIRTAFPAPCETGTDREALRKEAHALSAAAGLLGFMPLSRACSALEASAGQADFDTFLVQARDLARAAAEETRAMLADGRAAAGPAASGARR